MAKQKLGEFLLDRGVLQQNELTIALRLQRNEKKKLGSILVEQGFLNEEQLTSLMAEFFKLPLFTLKDVVLSPELMSAVPQAVALKNRIVPVLVKEDEIFVACAEPVNKFILENLRRMNGKRINPVYMADSELSLVLKQVYPDCAGTETSVLPEENVDPAGPDYAMKVLDNTILKAIALGASDLHMEPEKNGLRIRVRVDGVLRSIDNIPAVASPLVISRLKVLSNMNIAERRSPQDGGFAFQGEDGEPTNIRVSTLPCARGEKAVLRLLPSQERILNLEELGMEEDVVEALRSVLALPYGLILVTGPTGSGKTFTLYAALKYLRSDDVNIITIEDPIELQMEGINQSQVDDSSKKMTFSNTLRAILRQDPNIIMLGEIRDGETAKLALQAALTGHLVISTLHTNDAASAVDRLIDMGCERFLVGSALRAVLAQRLVRLICPRCRRKYKPTTGELLALGLNSDYQTEFYAGDGCPFCHGTGYKGRTAVTEFLVIDRDLQKLIAQGADTVAVKEYARDKMRSMRMDGIIKLRRGITTVSEVLKETVEW